MQFFLFFLDLSHDKQINNKTLVKDWKNNIF